MEEKKKLDLFQYLPFGGSFIIFLGVLRLIVFYGSFGVPIIRFLEFSEIITSFLDVVVLSVCFGLYSLVQGLFVNDREIKIANNNTYRIILSEKKFSRLLVLYLKYLSTAIIMCIVFFIVAAIASHYDSRFDNYTYLTLGVIFGGLILLVIARTENARKHFNPLLVKRKQLMDLAIIFMFFICVDCFIASFQTHQIRVNKIEYGTIINLDSGVVLKSDSSNYYIGSTKNYVFFYHEKIKTTEVFPMAKVRSMTFKSNE